MNVIVARKGVFNVIITCPLSRYMTQVIAEDFDDCKLIKLPRKDVDFVSDKPWMLWELPSGEFRLVPELTWWERAIFPPYQEWGFTPTLSWNIYANNDPEYIITEEDALEMLIKEAA